MKLRRKRMLEIMAIKKLRQIDIAMAIGVSQPQVSHFLKGRRKLNLKQSKRLIEFLGADIASMVIDWDDIGVCNPLGEA